jgi:hypothetical protein
MISSLLFQGFVLLLFQKSYSLADILKKTWGLGWKSFLAMEHVNPLQFHEFLLCRWASKNVPSRKIPFDSDGALLVPGCQIKMISHDISSFT